MAPLTHMSLVLVSAYRFRSRDTKKRGCSCLPCRVFKFDAKTLSNVAAATPPGSPAGVLKLPTVKIERIVFLGLPKKATYQAKLPSGKVGLLSALPASMISGLLVVSMGNVWL